MNSRQRLLATMNYQPRDRSPIRDFSFWDETLPHWRSQGLPEWVTRRNSDEFFGMDPDSIWSGVRVDLCPWFESKVMEDLGDQEIIQQADGVRVRRHKVMSSIPSHEGHLLVDRASWEAHYKPRLDPATPQRLDEKHIRELAAKARALGEDRDFVITVDGGSLYGKLRDWMGLEAISLLVYDDPGLFEEMVNTVADCIVGTLERAFAMGLVADTANLWEDMCYSAGPLLGPEQFKRYLLPHYKRITSLLRKHGVNLIILDSDGKIDELAPLWIEGGVNCLFPIEVGTWQADPIAFRRRYGRELRMMGGFCKQILAGPVEGIEREVRRLAPLVEEGGFVGYCDHRVPPNVPLRNYLHYLKCVREVWGKGVNLRPMHPAAEAILAGRA